MLHPRTWLVSATAEPQMGLEESVLNDATLLSEIDNLMELREAAREHRRAKRAIKEQMPREPGRYRVGPYLLTISSRTGGGFAIKRWTALVPTIAQPE